MANDLRLELRTRNNTLWHVIFDTYGSVAEFSRVRGFSNTEVGGFLNLTRTPYRNDGTARPLAQRIADSVTMLVEDLFPPDLYSGRFPRGMVAEIPSSAFRGLAAANRLALPATQEDDLIQHEIHEGIEAVLNTLTPREAKALRLRFGLSGHDEHSLDDTAKEFGVSRERIRQIEAKALRKLRHPSRCKQLRSYIDGVAIDQTVKRKQIKSEVARSEEKAQPIEETSQSIPAYLSRDALAVLRDGEALLKSMGVYRA